MRLVSSPEARLVTSRGTGRGRLVEAGEGTRRVTVERGRRRVVRLALGAIGGLIGGLIGHVASHAAEPRVLAPGYELQLWAEAPDIVTPVAITLDADGSLLVIESHTHQRPDDYDGPRHDRIRRLVDRDQNGRADQFTTFFADSDQTMSLAKGPEGWIYVATRREIFRLRDTDADGVADQNETLLRLETSGDYPHNGLAGLTFAPDGRLFFGMGENLGAPYRLVGADGRALSNQGEGGNVFCCSAEGRGLQRYATGFWNPFGSTFGPEGRLFTVDNDPDASPPCRLLNVVPGGDYGYQFRFGRSGRHPLQAWDAELPGTLPMASGTGEAPCQILPYDGRLWITSWGDYRLEAHRLTPTGATVQGQAETIIQGDQDFRPVGLAAAPDGSLYLSDWVNRSYPVHRQGRIWRLRPRHSTTGAAADSGFPPLSPAEQRAAEVRRQPQVTDWDDPDLFVRQAAMFGWSQSPELLPLAWDSLGTAAERIGFLAAWRWRDPNRVRSWLAPALADRDEDVQIYAMRIIAEQNLVDYGDVIDQCLRGETRIPGVRLSHVALATLAWLERGDDAKDQGVIHQRLAEILAEPDRPLSLRILALRDLPVDDDAVSLHQLEDYLTQQPDLAAEIVASLAARDEPRAGEMLAAIALSTDQPVSLRADAAAALAGYQPAQAETLDRLLRDPIPEVRTEATRAAGRFAALGRAAVSTALESWPEHTPGNPAAGRRVFSEPRERGVVFATHGTDGAEPLART